MKNKLRMLLALVCLLAGNQALAQVVGKALVVLGQAERIMTNGATTLKVGDEIEEKDIVRTLPGAVVQIGLKDGGFIAVRPSSSVSVEQFILDKANPQREKQITKVFAGSIQAVTGSIGKRLPSNVSYATPVATMGIRGTVVDLGIDSQGNSVGRVLVGSAQFSTPQGSIDMTRGSAVSVQRGQSPRKDAAAGRALANDGAAVNAQVAAAIGESPMDVVVATEKKVEEAKTLKKEIQAQLDDAAVAEEVKQELQNELAKVETAIESVEQTLDTVKTQLAVEDASVAAATATVEAARESFSAIETTEKALVEKAIIDSDYSNDYKDPETSEDALSDQAEASNESTEESTEAVAEEETATEEEVAEETTEEAATEEVAAEESTEESTEETAAADTSEADESDAAQDDSSDTDASAATGAVIASETTEDTDTTESDNSTTSTSDNSGNSAPAAGNDSVTYTAPASTPSNGGSGGSNNDTQDDTPDETQDDTPDDTQDGAPSDDIYVGDEQSASPY